MAVLSKPTLSDIAKRANISVPAVSMALADNPRISLKTKRLVWKISEEIGYRSLATDKLGNVAPSLSIRKVGFLVTGVGRTQTGISYDPVVTSMMMCLSADASEFGISVELMVLTEDLTSAELLQRATRFAKASDGLVVTGLIDAPLVDALKGTGVPFVALGHILSESGAECVTYDGEAAGRHATGHLLDAGHERVAFICERMTRGGIMQRWYHGYAIEHLERGLPLIPELKLITDPFTEPVMEAFDALFELPNPPTAVLVPNPYLTQALLNWQAQNQRELPMVTLELAEMPSPACLSAPTVILSVGKLTEQALRRLLEICLRPADQPLMTYVPVGYRDLD